jgi:hypothetical protein
MAKTKRIRITPARMARAKRIYRKWEATIIPGERSDVFECEIEDLVRRLFGGIIEDRAEPSSKELAKLGI